MPTDDFAEDVAFQRIDAELLPQFGRRIPAAQIVAKTPPAMIAQAVVAISVAAVSAASPEVILNAETAGERFLKPGRFNGKTGWTIWGTLRAGDWINVRESGKYQVSVTTFFHADGMHGRDTINGKPAETAKIALVAGHERKELDIPRAWKTSSVTVSLPAGISPVYVTGVWGTYFVHEIRITKTE